MSATSPQPKMKNFETLRAGWVIDGSGGPVQEHVGMAIRDGRIASLSPWRLDHAVRAEFLDLAEYTLLPCLVDSHVHLFMSGTSDLKVRARQLDVPFSSAKQVIAGHVKAHLRSGITAVRDGGDHHGHVLRYRDECLDADQAPFRLKAAGRAWHRAGRYGRLIGRASGEDQSLAQGISAEAATVDHVKIVNSGLNSLMKFGFQTAPQFNLEELREAAAAAQRKGLSVMVHANGRLPVEIALAAGCRSIEHGFFMGKENLSRMAQRGVYWVPTAATMKAYCAHLEGIGENTDTARRNLEDQMAQIALARKLGVRIAAGTDAGSIGVEHGSGIVAELLILKTAGLSIAETIQTATQNGAGLLNLAEPHVLQRGAPASFIAVKGRPDALPGSLLDSIGCICLRGGFILTQGHAAAFGRYSGAGSR